MDGLREAVGVKENMKEKLEGDTRKRKPGMLKGRCLWEEI